VWTELDDQGAIWTRAQVEVDEVWKGPAALGGLVVDQPGGLWGTSAAAVRGAARFSAGEEVVLFAETLGSGQTVPVGMFQGKYTVRMDPYSRSEIVQRFTLPAERSYDHRFLPLPAEADRLGVGDLEARVASRVRAGWDGLPIPGASDDALRRKSPALQEVR
jgi:hypothetical protein